jgi:hypothetical protein
MENFPTEFLQFLFENTLVEIKSGHHYMVIYPIESLHLMSKYFPQKVK